MVINLILFFITTFNLHKYNVSTSVARLARHQHHSENSKRMSSLVVVKQEILDEFILYGKLFVVMGLLWVCECIHYILHGDHSTIYDCLSYPELVFRILGCFNLARGFFIFVIFVCKKSTISKISRVKLCGVSLRFIGKIGKPRRSFGSSKVNASLGTTEHGDVVTLESWHNEDKMESLHVDGYPDDDLVPLNENHKNMTDQFKKK